jgi:cytidylate kinase
MKLDVGEKVLLDNNDVTRSIREARVTKAVSIVAAHNEVRAELVARQRNWVASKDGAVVEGRDIGTVVLPEADLKIFLTADPEERVARRVKQDAIAPSELSAAAESISRRDKLDSTRAVSPLVAAPGAIVVDSTGRSVEEVLEEVCSHL